MKKKKKPINVTIINDAGLEKLPVGKLKEAVDVALDIKHIGNATISLIILSDEEIIKINQEFLNHDYPTDVISFNLSEGKFLEGEIYISADTAIAQAEEYKVSVKEELIRLTVHGCLHLIGYNDNDEYSKAIMSQLENQCIDLIL